MSDTPRRSIRLDDELWNALLVKAAAQDTTASEVIRGLLAGWVNGTLQNVVGIKATALREAAYDIRERGDVGEDGGPSITDYLHARADQYLRGDRS